MKFDELRLKDFVTLASAAFGLMAILFAPSYWVAAVFVLLSVVFDWLDGTVARWTKHHNDFGRELDSLADAVAFGAAPAYLSFYAWQSSELAVVYGAASVVFMSAVLVRLARFNLYASEGVFYGMPAPAGAIVLVLLAPLSGQYWPVLALALSLLMLSKFKFKKPV